MQGIATLQLHERTDFLEKVGPCVFGMNEPSIRYPLLQYDKVPINPSLEYTAGFNSNHSYVLRFFLSCM
jgi:hypothetical protein